MARLPAIRGARNLTGHVFRSGDGERGSWDRGKVRCRRYSGIGMRSPECVLLPPQRPLSMDGGPIHLGGEVQFPILPGGDSHGSTAASHESVARIAANRRVAVIVPAFLLPQRAPAARA